jgi:hypothetical protein
MESSKMNSNMELSKVLNDYKAYIEANLKECQYALNGISKALENTDICMEINYINEKCNKIVACAREMRTHSERLYSQLCDIANANNSSKKSRDTKFYF